MITTGHVLGISFFSCGFNGGINYNIRITTKQQTVKLNVEMVPSTLFVYAHKNVEAK